MTIWYTADTHFGHENIIPFCGRPFRSAMREVPISLAIAVYEKLNVKF